jgi:hypothetical protein
MTKLLRFFLFVTAVFTASLLHAQPHGDDDLHFQGCHFFKNKIPFQTLSENDPFACGSNARSDSIDILNYAVSLDLTNFAEKKIKASCEITFTARQDGIEALPLDLLKLTVDSVTWEGAKLDFDYDQLLLNVHLPQPVNINDTMEVVVFYQGTPTADPSGFGGFVFENNIGYNLGIGLSSNPYNFGRSWHPCFDNFVERATYDINVITNDGRKGYAIGTFLGETDLGGGMALRQYRMAQQLPTYLVGVAASTYAEIHQTHTGEYGTYPMLLVGKPGDTTNMKSAFTYLGDAVDNLEAWFGPYIWGQVGYVMTTAGAMEHSSLIAYPDFIIAGGPAFNQNRLMAHELGHHWWGNITTLSCPSDMWIKEGNAEYSAHLFTESVFGKEAFVKQVKDNHAKVVLKSAHIEDEGYWPLSGIPYEHTYGTHTYNKGASIMHNLRGYLGDTLFQKGMTSILETFKFQSVDATLFRDQLTANTGVDMTSFFNDWIFSPGFALYELDSVKVEPTPIPEDWKATVYIQQKLRAAPHFHTNVPLDITFFDKNWNTYTATMMISGEFSEVELTIPFEPVWQILNDGNRLNLARMQDRKAVYQPGTVVLENCEVSTLQVVEAPDSALVSFIHYWGAPDADPNQNVTMSSTHYWRYGGIIPQGFKAKAQIPIRAATPDDLDYDLAGDSYDSLIVVWRPNTAAAWMKYPYFKRISNIIKIDTLLPGDYAFANGDLPVATGLDDLKNEKVEMTIFPNPAGDEFTVQAAVPAQAEMELMLFDAMGRLVRQEKVRVNGGLLSQRVSTDGLPSGVYWLRLSDAEGRFYGIEKLIKKN